MIAFCKSKHFFRNQQIISKEKTAFQNIETQSWIILIEWGNLCPQLHYSAITRPFPSEL